MCNYSGLRPVQVPLRTVQDPLRAVQVPLRAVQVPLRTVQVPWRVPLRAVGIGKFRALFHTIFLTNDLSPCSCPIGRKKRDPTSIYIGEASNKVALSPLTTPSTPDGSTDGRSERQYTQRTAAAAPRWCGWQPHHDPQESNTALLSTTHAPASIFLCKYPLKVLCYLCLADSH